MAPSDRQLARERVGNGRPLPLARWDLRVRLITSKLPMNIRNCGVGVSSTPQWVAEQHVCFDTKNHGSRDAMDRYEGNLVVVKTSHGFFEVGGAQASRRGRLDDPDRVRGRPLALYETMDRENRRCHCVCSLHRRARDLVVMFPVYQCHRRRVGAAHPKTFCRIHDAVGNLPLLFACFAIPEVHRNRICVTPLLPP